MEGDEYLLGTQIACPFDLLSMVLSYAMLRADSGPDRSSRLLASRFAAFRAKAALIVSHICIRYSRWQPDEALACNR